MTNNIVRKRKILLHRGRHRAKRPRTFKSIELATKWASAQGIKAFEVVKMSLGISKKYKIVEKAK